MQRGRKGVDTRREAGAEPRQKQGPLAQVTPAQESFGGGHEEAGNWGRGKGGEMLVSLLLLAGEGLR